MSVYKISGYGLNYYGSTTKELNKRLYQHKANYKRYLNNNMICPKVSIYKIFELGDDYNIELVEEVLNIDELKKREGYYIKNNECINNRIAGRDNKEWFLDNKDHIKEYQLKYQNEYNLKNKDKIKAYQVKNKDKLKAYRKEYYKLKKRTETTL